MGPHTDQTRLPRRMVLQGFVGSAGAAILAACGGASSSDQTATANANAPKPTATSTPAGSASPAANAATQAAPTTVATTAASSAAAAPTSAAPAATGTSTVAGTARPAGTASAASAPAGTAGAASAAAGTNANTLAVIAGENFWGSIAAQLGGPNVKVTSIVTDPNTDPHEYQSNAETARTFATGKYVILNGAGYDSWADQLLQANPVSGRKVFTVADLLGKKEGDNPHFWYDPDAITRVATQITADFKTLDAAHASDYDARNTQFLTVALKPYHDRIAAIKAQFAGQKVGATESIFVYLATALGLNLISPPEFMDAVAEGNDPPASTVAEFQQQIAQKQITVLVYNVQTVTDLTTSIQQQATKQTIPVVGISETLQPVSATFQDWQVNQLMALQDALAKSK